MILQQIIHKMALKPRKLFLIDGFGALLSAFLLGVILVRFEGFFGMPANVLYVLSLMACVFAVYDFICYLRITKNWRPFLKAIAIANLIYCLISIGLIFHHFQKLTAYGILYFLFELAILFILIYIELKTAGKNRVGNEVV